MRFNNPIPRTGLPRFHESSKLRPLRDSDSVARIWQKTEPLEKNGRRLANAVELLQRQFDRLRRRSAAESQQGMVYRGEWSALGSYNPQNLVTRGVLGEFICLTQPPVGTTPETGAPYWHALAGPPPGNWA